MSTDVAIQRPILRSLSDELGIIPGYQDQTGKEWRETSDETRVLLLAAMGVDASTEEAAEAALEEIRQAKHGQPLEPVRVVEIASDDAERVIVQLPEPQRDSIRWELELEEESGRTHRAEGVEENGSGYTLALPLPAPAMLGYHTLRLALETTSGTQTAEQALIVVPASAVRATELVGGKNTWGLIANLYTLRANRNWGVGDFTDLGDLLAWAGELGAQFVGVNPLHALHNEGMGISPYSPVSRIFRNPLYLDIERIPELQAAPEVRAKLGSPEVRRELAELRSSTEVDYERIIALKLALLELLYRTFAESEGQGEEGSGAVTMRRRAYEKWRAAREPELTDYATYMALANSGEVPGSEFQVPSLPGETADNSELGTRNQELGVLGPDWRSWPSQFHDPRSSAVREFQRVHGDRVDFYRWLQFETDRQLGDAANRAREAGMKIGLYQDLAIGTSPASSDTWSSPDLFVRGVCIGAPPDPYSDTGQNWGLPPIDPRRLREGRYRYFIRLVRAAFRHAGALRIDHVMGLFRSFWIPDGRSGSDGAYVRYPSDDLLGILALESVRNNALVVGEDLGTVPPDVPPALAKWGLLSSKVLYFERDDRGAFLPADRYAAEALATANTHDMATLSGFWEGRDIELRANVGLLKPGDVRAAREERVRDKRALLRALARAGVLDKRVDPDSADPQISVAELRGAVHDFLALTPSVLVGVGLDDVAGEVDPVNVPGVGPDRHPSWKRRMTKSLERLREDPETEVALGTKLRDVRK